MKIKFVSLVVFISLVALSFAGCSSKSDKKIAEKFITPSSSKATSSQTIAEATTEKPTDKEISSQLMEELATMVSTEPQNDDNDTSFTPVHNCVSTEREQTFTLDYSNEAFKYRIPRINLSSADASRVNSEIKEKYTKEFDSINNNNGSSSDTNCFGIDYSYYTADNILSVIVEARYTGSCVYHQVYNFDISTGEQLDNYQLLEKLGKSFSDIKDNLKDAIREDYDKNYGSIATEYTQNLERTLSDSNINDVKLFINGSNDLRAICREYSSVGADSYEHKVSINL